MSNTINADNGVVSTVPGLKYSADTSGELILQTNTTNALTLDTTQGATFSTGALVTNPYAGSYSSGMVLDHTTSLGRISVAASSGIAFYNGGISARVETMRISSAGFVGINTASPGTYLDIVGPSGTVTAPSYVNQTVTSIRNNFHIRVAMVNPSNTYASEIQRYNAGAAFPTHNFSLSGGSGFVWLYGDGTVTPTERMRIDTSGNVGVGTTTMYGKFNSIPKSTFNAQGTTWAEAALSTQSSYGGGLSMIDGSAGYLLHVQDSGATFVIRQGTVGAVSAERMRIDSNGNILVNTTTSSYSSANRGNITIGGTASAILGFQKSGVAKGYVYLDGSDQFQLWNESATSMIFGTNALERMRIDASGNVGIGTTSPAYLLNVSKNGSGGDLAQFVRITDTNTSNSVGPLHLTIGAANHFAVSPGMVLAGTNSIALAVGDGSDLASQRKLTIDSSGNVGIGTNSPASYGAKLAITGNQDSKLISYMRNDSSGSSSASAIALNAYGNTWGMEIGSAAKNSNSLTWQLDYGGANLERMRLDTSGNLQLSTASTSILNSSGRKILNQTGGILQVVQTYSSTQISFTNTGAWADSGISVTITPSSTSSRILIMTSFGSGQSASGYNNIFGFSRNGTVIGGNTGQNNAWVGEDGYGSANLATSAAMYVDSPATTSACTYMLLVRCDGNTGYLNRSGGGGGTSVGETTGSTQIIVMEIAG
jgi:hypothetical protein